MKLNFVILNLFKLFKLNYANGYLNNIGQFNKNINFGD